MKSFYVESSTPNPITLARMDTFRAAKVELPVSVEARLSFGSHLPCHAHGMTRGKG